MLISYWSSEVCSSDLTAVRADALALRHAVRRARHRRGQAQLHGPRVRRADAGGDARGEGRVRPRRHPQSGEGAAAVSGKLDALLGDIRACRICERSEEHTSELQSLMRISYAVFCLKKKKTHTPKQI